MLSLTADRFDGLRGRFPEPPMCRAGGFGGGPGVGWQRGRPATAAGSMLLQPFQADNRGVEMGQFLVELSENFSYIHWVLTRIELSRAKSNQRFP